VSSRTVNDVMMISAKVAHTVLWSVHIRISLINPTQFLVTFSCLCTFIQG